MDIDLINLIRLFAFLLLIDFISGVIKSAKLGELKSKSCSNELFKCMGETLILVIVIYLERGIPGINNYLSMFIIGFIFKESLSICENLFELGVWIPESLKRILNTNIENVNYKK